MDDGPGDTTLEQSMVDQGCVQAFPHPRDPDRLLVVVRDANDGRTMTFTLTRNDARLFSESLRAQADAIDSDGPL